MASVQTFRDERYTIEVETDPSITMLQPNTWATYSGITTRMTPEQIQDWLLRNRVSDQHIRHIMQALEENIDAIKKVVLSYSRSSR